MPIETLSVTVEWWKSWQDGQGEERTAYATPHAGPQGGVRRPGAQAASGSICRWCGVWPQLAVWGQPEVKQEGLRRLELRGPHGHTCRGAQVGRMTS